MRALACIFLCACSVPPATVPWARSFGATGRENATSLAEAADGGVLLAGDTLSSFSDQGTHPWLVRVTGAGAILWQETLAGKKSETHPVLAARVGGFIMAANTYSDGAGKADIWVVSLNDDGSVAWQKALGGAFDDLVAGVVARTDGSIDVFATTSSFGQGNADWLLIRLEANGTVSSARTYGDGDDQHAGGIAHFSDDSVILTGDNETLGDSDVAFAAIDSKGDLSGATAIGGTGTDTGIAVSTENDSFTLLASTTSYGAGGEDAWVIGGKHDGTIASQRAFGDTGDDRLVSIRSNWALGTTTIGSDTQLWLVGLAGGGVVTTEKAYGGTGAEDGAAIGQAPNGDLFLHGTTRSFGNTGPDFWLARLDSSLDLFQLGKPLTTQHTATNAKPRALTFITSDANLADTVTKVMPTLTTGRVMPTVGN